MAQHGRSAPRETMADTNAEVHRSLWERLGEARRQHPDVVERLLGELGLSYLALAEDPLGVRLGDLAVAVHRVEHVTGERVGLPSGELKLVYAEDAARNPGFDGVEQEWWEEEARLVELRARMASR